MQNLTLPTPRSIYGILPVQNKKKIFSEKIEHKSKFALTGTP